jgi:hypothetical protein
MTNRMILYICIEDIYLNFVFISKNLKYLFGTTLAIITILISMRLISFLLGAMDRNRMAESIGMGCRNRLEYPCYKGPSDGPKFSFPNPHCQHGGQYCPVS